MNRYQINYQFTDESDINKIFIKVLRKELKEYIQKMCPHKKGKLSLTSDSKKEDYIA